LDCILFKFNNFIGCTCFPCFSRSYKSSSSYKPPYKTPPFYPFDLPKGTQQSYFSGYNVQVKRFGTFRTVGFNLPRGLALSKGSDITRRTLGATFRITPSKQYTPRKDISFNPPSDIFRNFMIRGKKRIPLQDTFIQLRSKRLSSPLEVGEIQSSKRRWF
jgi:hypothetical protein